MSADLGKRARALVVFHKDLFVPSAEHENDAFVEHIIFFITRN